MNYCLVILPDRAQTDLRCCRKLEEADLDTMLDVMARLSLLSNEPPTSLEVNPLLKQYAPPAAESYDLASLEIDTQPAEVVLQRFFHQVSPYKFHHKLEISDEEAKSPVSGVRWQYSNRKWNKVE